MQPENGAHAGTSVFFDHEVEGQFLNLIKSANQSIIFVTPYFDPWVHLKDEIRDALSRRVEVTLLIRQDNADHKEESLDWLLANNVKVYLIPNLHAKIYLNEKSVLVSSMNLHRTSIIDSKDFAIAIGNNAEALKFREYVVRLMGKGTRLQSQMSIRNQISRISDKAGKILPGRSLIPRDNGVGFCVRSRHKIGFNPEKPLCPDCYREWSKYENEEYEENYCHSCGNEAETTFSKPLCRPCWKKHN